MVPEPAAADLALSVSDKKEEGILNVRKQVEAPFNIFSLNVTKPYNELFLIKVLHFRLASKNRLSCSNYSNSLLPHRKNYTLNITVLLCAISGQNGYTIESNSSFFFFFSFDFQSSIFR